MQILFIVIMEHNFKVASLGTEQIISCNVLKTQQQKHQEQVMVNGGRK